MESPLIGKYLSSESKSYLKNYNSKSPNDYILWNNSEPHSHYLSSLKIFPTTKTKNNFICPIYTNNKENIFDESQSKVSIVSKQITFSNSLSKPTKNTSNYYNSFSNLLNKKRNYNVGSIKKNLMPTLQDNSKFYNNMIINYDDKNFEEEDDIEKMVDFIINTTKPYKKDKNYKTKSNSKIYFDSNNKNKSQNINPNSICKCKKVGCSKFSCNCLKKGNKCSIFCKCIGCENK